VNIIKFDLDYEVAGVAIEDRFRGEFYDLSTQRSNLVAYIPSPPNQPPFSLYTQQRTETDSYFNGANALRLEKKFTDWFFGSAGYLYSKLNSDATFSLDTVTLPGLIDVGDKQFLVPQITLEQESHVANLNGLLSPFSGLTVSAGAQSEWTRQSGFGSGTLNQTFPPGPVTPNPATMSSDYDKTLVQESLALRYNKIPFTALFAEARLEQQRIGQSDGLSAPQNVDQSVFLQQTDFSSDLMDLRFGFNTSPWQSVALSAHYRIYENQSTYDSPVFIQPLPPPTAYPTFIRSRDLLTDEVEAKLAWHPCPRVKTTLSYQYLKTDYWMVTGPFTTPLDITPGGNLLSGQDNAHVYSLGATVNATTRLFISGTFSYQRTSSTTADAGSPAIVPYRGDIYSAIASGTYVLSQTTDLFAAYAFSDADYGQNNYATGVPVGLEYQMHGLQVGLARRFGKNVSTKFQYRFATYDEPSSGSANNYRAHALFATLTLRFP
jgi:hypothetical protein